MASRYWVGGTATWDATVGTKWALTSGGAGGQAVPTASDDVFFDATSGAVTCTVSGSRVCKSLTCTGFTGSLIGSTTPVLTISGNMTLASGMTLNSGLSTNSVAFTLNATGNITTAGKTPISLTLNLAGATFTLLDNLTMGTGSTGQITLTAGIFDANDFDVQLGVFSSSGTGTRTLNMGNGTWTFVGSSSVPWATGTVTNFTLNAEGSSVIIAGTAAVRAMQFGSTSKTLNNLTTGGSTTNLVIAQGLLLVNGTFTPGAGLIGLYVGGTVTFTNPWDKIVLDPFVEDPFFIESYDTGVAVTLNFNSGTSNFKWCAFKDVILGGTSGTIVMNDCLRSNVSGGKNPAGRVAPRNTIINTPALVS